MIRVVLVDDEIRLQRAWEKLFAAHPDVQLVATLARADELGRVVESSRPHIVVIDLSMPGTDPLEAIRALASSHPEVRTVVFSARSEPAIIRAAFDAGAWGYIDKLAPPADILGVLRAVAGGEVVFPGGTTTG